MATTSFSPRFVRARIVFKYEGATYDLGERLINSSGLPNLPWTAFDPMAHLGKRGVVSVEVLSKTPWQFSCDALITCERVSGKTDGALGLTFLFKPDDVIGVDAAVAVEGLLPDYVRKLPRIHFLPLVPIFPSRAIMRFFYGKEDIAVACDVENLSPSGFLVHTDDSRTDALLPDETVRFQLQPRGFWLRAVMVNSVVKRTTHMIDPATGNTRRYFGLAITTASPEARVNFTDLLRQIVLLSKR